MLSEKEELYLNELIIKCMDGSISEKELSELNVLVKSKPSAAKAYMDFIFINSGLSQPGEIGTYIIHSENADQTDDKFVSTVLSDNFWNELLISEQTAPSVKIFEEYKKRAQRATEEKQKVQVGPRKVNKLTLAAACLSLAALLFIAVWVNIVPESMQVAVLIESINAKWADPEKITNIGDEMWNSEGFRRLDEGVVKIAFNDGAQVIIEAPAEFELKSQNRMFLESGQLFANVSGRAKGFVVSTPNSEITDLGTKFGVEVGDKGTSVHMFKGKASLRTDSKAHNGDQSILTTGHAKHVDTMRRMKDIEIGHSQFIQGIDSKREFVWKGQNFDLADVIVGGDGFGAGSEDVMLDPLGGKFVNEKNAEKERMNIWAGKQYYSVNDSNYIDGVFVPGVKKGAVVISSQGHVYADCPKTNGKFHHYITNGPAGWDYLNYYDVDGQVYDAVNDPSIYLHANLGITFDLNKIRNDLPGLSIEGFKTLCVREIIEKSYPKASFVILVDGVVKFKSGATLPGDSIPVDLEINETDGFLTLVAIDVDDNISYDRTYFIHPQLLLTSVE